LDRRLGGLQSQSGRGGEEKNSQPLPGFEPLIIQRIVIPVHIKSGESGMMSIAVFWRVCVYIALKETFAPIELCFVALAYLNTVNATYVTRCAINLMAICGLEAKEL
jgi:hypothetical protein